MRVSGEERRKQVVESYDKNGGNVSAVARELKLTRSTVQEHLRKIGRPDKPLVCGLEQGIVTEKLQLPPTGRIRRYLLTSAQNNTRIYEPMWKALNNLAKRVDAAIMVGTFTYNTNAYGRMSVKRGTEHDKQTEPWYDPRLSEFIVDRRVELGNGLVWCGEMNILPTAANPLEGLETYTHRKSAIFPHAKVAMRSVATMMGEGTKLNYTTGTVTVRNYIQKKEGLKAEHHHAYAALMVEVNDQGNWWVRQVHCDDKGRMQDLDLIADAEGCRGLQPVEAVTWGDLHATISEPWVVEQSLHMLDELRPKYQFLHDVLEGASINRHLAKNPNPHSSFYRWKRGLHRVGEELAQTAEIINRYMRPWCTAVVPDSNHDGWWLKSWLANFDYRVDPANAQLFLRLQSWMYSEIDSGIMPRDVNITRRVFEDQGIFNISFLLPDESFVIAGNRIECGMHGHLGVNGAGGSPASLNKVGRRANTAHTHSAGIYNGLYVAGTSSKLKWDYNHGPSSWSHSHIVTYPNGARTVVTMFAGRWRA